MNENPPATKHCPKCGTALSADAVEGLCPACLLSMNLATQTNPGTEADPAAGPAQAPAPSPETVAKHFPQYEILECLGRGGMGVVYKARQKSLDRLVALKILAPEREKDPQFAERFAREAKTLAQLNHPNIVTVHDFGEAGGMFYLVMEFVDGVNLHQLLGAGRLAPKEALAIVPAICEALQFAHDRGIVHRDIKPGNVLLDKQGRVKIADFGIARIMGAVEETAGAAQAGGGARPGLTGARTLGTPAYMAPEQAANPAEVDHRADIYALGVVFYQMLTGELPGKPIEPPSRKVQVDVRLDEVVLRALEQKPELRYQQASVLKTQIETIASTPPPSAAAAASAAGPSASPATPPLPPDLWQQIKARFWPPLVVRRNGRRVIHWLTVAQRGLAGLLAALVACVCLGLAFGMENGSRFGFLAGAGLFVFGCLIGAGAMAIEILQGFAGPMNRLPELDQPGTGGGVSVPAASVPPTTPGSAAASAAPVGAAPGATANKSGMVRLFETLFGSAFTSPLAIKLINVSALGFLGFLGSLGFLGYGPPGWHWCFGFLGFCGFFGFFWLIGVAFIVEAFARRKGGSSSATQCRFVVVGRRGGKAVVNWPGVLLFFFLLCAFMEGAAICMGATTNGTPAFLFAVAVMFTVLRIRRGLATPLDRLVPLDAPPAAVVPPSNVTGPSETAAGHSKPWVSFCVAFAYAGTVLFGLLAEFFLGHVLSQWWVRIFLVLSCLTPLLALLLSQLATPQAWRTWFKLAAWLGAVTWLPVIGFATYFLYAISTLDESPWWAASLDDIILLSLIWLGAVALPICIVRLWRAVKKPVTGSGASVPPVNAPPMAVKSGLPRWGKWALGCCAAGLLLLGLGMVTLVLRLQRGGLEPEAIAPAIESVVVGRDRAHWERALIKAHGSVSPGLYFLVGTNSEFWLDHHIHGRRSVFGGVG